MSDLGPISFGGEDEVFLGRDFMKTRDFSEKTASAVDDAVHRLCAEGYNDAKAILEKYIDILHALAHELFERETLDAAEIDAIIERVGGPDVLPKREEKPESEPVSKQEAPVEASLSGDKAGTFELPPFETPSPETA